MSNTQSGGNKKRSSPSRKAYYQRYKQQGLYLKHKRKKMEHQLKLQPNNKQLENAIGSLIHTSTKFAK